MMMNNPTQTRTQTQLVIHPVVVVCVVLVDGWFISRRGAGTKGHMMTTNFLSGTIRALNLRRPIKDPPLQNQDRPADRSSNQDVDVSDHRQSAGSEPGCSGKN